MPEIKLILDPVKVAETLYLNLTSYPRWDESKRVPKGYPEVYADCIIIRMEELGISGPSQKKIVRLVESWMITELGEDTYNKCRAHHFIDALKGKLEFIYAPVSTWGSC